MYILSKYKFSLLVLLFFFSFVLPIQSQNSNTNNLEDELSRNWNVVILPFITDGTESVRTSPLVQRLPLLIEDNLSLLSERYLSEGEIEGYIQSLVEQFPNAQIDPEIIPRSRSLNYSINDIESGVLKELYFASIRTLVNEEQPFSAPLLQQIRDTTNADLFLTGVVEIQDQYLFLDFLLISPYTQSDQSLLSQNLFTRRSIEALSTVEEFILWDLGRSIFNSPSGRLEIIDIENEETIRVYIDNRYFGTAPLIASPLSVGTHRVELFTEDSIVYSNNVDIIENEIVTLNIRIDEEEYSQFALNTVPSGISVYLYSQFLGNTPLLLNRTQNTEYLQLIDDEIRSSYFEVSSSTPDMLSIALTNQNFDASAQVTKDREEFYASLGFTIFSGILPLVFAGISADRTALESDSSRFSLTGSELESFQRDSAIINGLTVSSIVVLVLFLVNTVDELLDYLQGAEYARALVR